MSATQAQIDKVTAAIQPLYDDPDFAGVTDILLELTQTPPAPAPEVDPVDVPKPAEEAPVEAAPAEPSAN